MDPIAREHVQQAKDIYAKAKTGVHVLILGPYHPEGEKAHLLSLKSKLLEKGVQVSLLEDHPEGDDMENYRTKFDMACKILRDSQVTPVICNYLPIDAPSGPLSELINLVDDPAKYSLRKHVRVFTQKGTRLPDQSKSIPTIWEVADGEEFIELAYGLALREVQNKADLFTFQKEGHNVRE